MSGDYSGQKFDPARDFSNLLLQQGRVTLDTDWNEFAAIIERRERTTTVDTIGRSAVPRETIGGFKISCTGSGSARALLIGRGRVYVDGYLAENHGAAPFSFDMASINAKGDMTGVLAEQIGTDSIMYTAQPYPPNPQTPSILNSLLVYIDVWQREVTYIEDGGLLESALGGVDTATRTQTIWQVKYLDGIGSGVKCAKADELQAWQDLIKPSAGRLTTKLTKTPDPDDPCLLPPTAGFRGLENQFYRVEIHKGGDANTATFKWSRDHASIVASVLTIEKVGNEDVLTVTRVARDQVLRFSAGDWLEITDDRRELAGTAGELRKIKTVNDDTRKITLSGPAIPADLRPATGTATDPTRHPRIRRWDQKHKVLDTATSPNTIVDLDASTSTGAIPVSVGKTIALENGIEITFALDPASGTFRSGDHWTFAARAADASIELLTDAPPRGIHHHYARLAIVAESGTVEDCRKIWPPEADCCGCTVCVTPQGHADGSLTIQMAIDQVKKRGGGTVCLDIGTYPLVDPIKIDTTESLRLVGQGYWKTILTWTGESPAISISNSKNVVAEAFDVRITPFNGDTICASGFLLEGTTAVTVRDCWVSQDLAKAHGDSAPAVSLKGTQLGTLITRNILFSVFDGISNGVGGSEPLKSSLLVVRENYLLCARWGILFGDSTTHDGDTLIVDNAISGCSECGIECRGGTPGEAHVVIDENVLCVAGDGIVAGTKNASILHNHIFRTDDAKGEDGIVLDGAGDYDVVGNRIARMSGTGVLMRRPIVSAMIKQNIIRNTGSGIVMKPAAVGTDGSPVPLTQVLAIENNQLCDIMKAPRTSEDAAAISIVHVDQLRISANTIRSLAPEQWTPSVLAAIDVSDCTTVLVSANNIVDIVAPANTIACAIWVRTASFSAQITDNVIRRSSGAPSGGVTPWYAIYFGLGPPSTGTSSTTQPGESTAPLGSSVGPTLGDAAAAATATILRDVHRPQISILGNNCVSWKSSTPAIWAQWTDATCMLSNNQCEMSADSTADSVVYIDGENVAVTGNIIRARHDTLNLAMGRGQAQAQVLSRAIKFKTGNSAHVPNHATVLGNLTLGGIWVGGNLLGGTWAALNDMCT